MAGLSLRARLLLVLAISAIVGGTFVVAGTFTEARAQTTPADGWTAQIVEINPDGSSAVLQSVEVQPVPPGVMPPGA